MPNPLDFLPESKKKIIIEHPQLGKSFFSREIDKKEFIKNLRAFARDLCDEKLNTEIRFTPREILSIFRAFRNYPYQKWAGNTMGLEDDINDGIKNAQALFGDRFYGPAHIYDAFGYNISNQDLPSFPDKTLMEKAKALGAVLALRVYGLLMPKEEESKRLAIFQIGFTPREESNRQHEWKMFLPQILPQTINRDYFEQTRAIRDYLNRAGLLANDVLSECVDEKLDKIEDLSQIHPNKAINLLTSLKINQKHRHSPEDIIYFNKLIHFREDDFEATNADLSTYKGRDGGFILVGKFTDTRVMGFGMASSMAVNKSYESFGQDHYKQGVRIVL